MSDLSIGRGGFIQKIMKKGEILLAIRIFTMKIQISRLLHMATLLEVQVGWLNALGHLTKYLSLTVFTLLVVIESARIYLGHYGNLSRRVPELAGFLMLTILMQMPLVSFFLFNPYLMSTPMETTLHTMLWLLTLAEVAFSFLALKQASNFAKSIYLSQPKDR